MKPGRSLLLVPALLGIELIYLAVAWYAFNVVRFFPDIWYGTLFYLMPYLLLAGLSIGAGVWTPAISLGEKIFVALSIVLIPPLSAALFLLSCVMRYGGSCFP